MLYLKEANLEDIEKEYELVRDMPLDENGFTNQWCGVSREDFENNVILRMIESSKGIALKPGRVPQTFYFLWNDDTVVGQFRIRHYLNDELRNGAGHIGYYIKKEFRGKGYAKEGLRLTLEIAKNIVPEEEIYLRVDKSNPASLKVMLHNGGRIVDEDDKKYYVRIKN